MATHNRAAFLREALDSLAGQTRAPDEIIVVNDASTDKTASVLEQYRPGVEAIELDANQGKPAAINLALARAVGTYLWIFDDDVALPDALANHLAFLAANPDVDFTCSDKYLFETGGDIWDSSRWRTQPLTHVTADTFLFRTMLSMNTLMQGMLVPARCYQAVGGFDPTLARAEDHDMVLRLARRFKVGNLGEPTFVYRQHAGARGAGAALHGASDRFKILLAYRQAIFCRVRAQWPLALFLDERNPELNDRDRPLDERERGQALLRRSCVMLRHALSDEALEDLDAGLAAIAAHGDGRLGATGELLKQALDISPWTWPTWPRDLRRLSAVVSRHRVRGTGRCLARGLYWNTRRELDHRAYRQASLSALMLTYFALSRLVLKLGEKRS